MLNKTTAALISILALITNTANATAPNAYGDFKNEMLAKEQEYLIAQVMANDLPKEPTDYLVTENQEVIGNYYHGKTLKNVFSIPLWKYEIMDKAGLSSGQKIHYNIINNLECGKEDGFCVGSDIGPFQINRAVHPKDRNRSLRLIEDGKKEELYAFQLQWTINRLESYKERRCNDYWPNENEVFRCMLKVHNGNNKQVDGGLSFKDVYAIKGLEIKNILKKYADKKEQRIITELQEKGRKMFLAKYELSSDGS